MPSLWPPLVAGAAVILLSLPLFVAAGWDLRGWTVGAVLWAGSRALAALVTHLNAATSNLARGGLVGFGMTLRALVVLVAIVALAASDPELALAATLLYALAYTVELAVSLMLYFGGEPRT